jgi:hypothetical protein
MAKIAVSGASTTTKWTSSGWAGSPLKVDTG